MPLDIENVIPISIGSGLSGTGESGDPLDTATKHYYERFDVSASTNQLTVTVNGGVVPTGTDAEISAKARLYQRPGGKLLFYPDDWEFSGSNIDIDSGAVSPVAASYVLYFED